MTVRALAQATGLNISNISLIETGKRIPQIDTLIKILDALDAELMIRKKDGRNDRPFSNKIMGRKKCVSLDIDHPIFTDRVEKSKQYNELKNKHLIMR